MMTGVYKLENSDIYTNLDVGYVLSFFLVSFFFFIFNG